MTAKDEVAPETLETITRDDLAEALHGLPLFLGNDERTGLSSVDPHGFAVTLFDRVSKRRREGEARMERSR